MQTPTSCQVQVWIFERFSKSFLVRLHEYSSQVIRDVILICKCIFCVNFYCGLVCGKTRLAQYVREMYEWWRFFVSNQILLS